MVTNVGGLGVGLGVGVGVIEGVGVRVGEGVVVGEGVGVRVGVGERDGVGVGVAVGDVLVHVSHVPLKQSVLQSSLVTQNGPRHRLPTHTGQRMRLVCVSGSQQPVSVLEFTLHKSIK